MIRKVTTITSLYSGWILSLFYAIYIKLCIDNHKDPARQNPWPSAITTQSRETTRAFCLLSDSRPTRTFNRMTTIATTSLRLFATRSEQTTPKKAQSTTATKPTSTAICITISIGTGCILLLSHTARPRRRRSMRRSMYRCLQGSNSIWRKGQANGCP